MCEMVIQLTSEKFEFLLESPRFVFARENVCVYVCGGDARHLHMYVEVVSI